MKRNELTIPWIVGGNIPHQDVEALERLGAVKAFSTGTKVSTVVQFFNAMKQVVKA